MRIYIGSDHAGVKQKDELVKSLVKKGYTVEDVGSFDEKSTDDYPDFAYAVAEAVANSKISKGILICGSGTGMVIAANKVKGVRAAVCYDNYTAKMARYDNNSNIICLRSRGIPVTKNKQFLNTFLKTEFSGLSRHKRRVRKLSR